MLSKSCGMLAEIGLGKRIPMSEKKTKTLHIEYVQLLDSVGLSTSYYFPFLTV